MGFNSAPKVGGLTKCVVQSYFLHNLLSRGNDREYSRIAPAQ